MPGTVPGGETQTDLPSSWSRHLSGERKKINKKCNHNVGKQYKIIEGEWYYGSRDWGAWFCGRADTRVHGIVGVETGVLGILLR